MGIFDILSKHTTMVSPENEQHCDSQLIESNTWIFIWTLADIYENANFQHIDHVDFENEVYFYNSNGLTVTDS